MLYPNIDPIAFNLGQMEIRWYGVMHLVAFLLAFWFCAQRREQPVKPWTIENIADMFFYVAFGVIFGGTMGYWLIYEPSRIIDDPFILFKFWLPGRSFHGGLIGVFLALYFYGRKNHRSLLEITDFIAPAVPIGLGLGRIGNFLNGELWGRTTDLPWGMVFPYAGDEARHPSQLYEGLLEGVLLFVILYFFSQKRRGLGAISGLFALGYGVFRFIVEFVREPDQNQEYFVWDWLTIGQLLSFPMIMIGLYLLWKAHLALSKEEINKNTQERIGACNNT